MLVWVAQRRWLGDGIFKTDDLVTAWFMQVGQTVILQAIFLLLAYVWRVRLVKSAFLSDVDGVKKFAKVIQCAKNFSMIKYDDWLVFCVVTELFSQL